MLVTLGHSALCLGLLAFACLAPAQEPQLSTVYTASLENQKFDKGRNEVSFDLVNNGSKPVTMFFFSILGTGPDGAEHACGGMGQDMITWTGYPPAVNVPPSWTEGWIQPNEHRHMTRPADGCLTNVTTLTAARAKLDAIMFDDGTGEGDPNQIAFTLSHRRDERDEMKKWTPQFLSLLKDPDFGTATAHLYQELVEADHDAAVDPDIADTNRARISKEVRDRLKRLLLEIREYSKTGKKPSDSTYLTWHIQDVNTKTERLIRGTSAEP